jgi:hypothetical protein
VHQAAQEGPRGDDDGLGLEAAAVGRPNPGHAAGLLKELFRHPFHERQVRRVFQGPASEARIEGLVALRPRPPDSGAARSVQDLELDARLVRQDAHEPAERVHFGNELSLGQTSDRRVAGHPANRGDLPGQECRPAAHPRRGMRRLDPRVTAPDDKDLESQGSIAWDKGQVKS